VRSIYTVIWLAGLASCNLPMAGDSTTSKSTGSTTSSTTPPGYPAASKGPVSSRRSVALPSPTGEGAAADDDAVVMRAGVRRLEAYRDEDLPLRHVPDPSIKLPEVDAARAGRRLGATVGPFTQRDWIDEAQGQGADVSRGAEIVALALGQQLRLMGWVVEMMVAGSDERTKRSKDAKGRGSAAKRLTRFRFSGDAAFWAESHATRSRGVVECHMAVRDADGKTIFDDKVRGEQMVSSKQQPSLVRRLAAAQQGALKGFVRALFSSERLRQALVLAVTRARRGKR